MLKLAALNNPKSLNIDRLERADPKREIFSPAHGDFYQHCASAY